MCAGTISALFLGEICSLSRTRSLSRIAQEYIVAKTGPEAIPFCCMSGLQFVMPYLKREWEAVEGITGQRRISKEDQGMILLIEHPDWTDEQIRQAVKTTDKQMMRWSNFNAARSAQKYYKDRAKGR